MAKNSYENFKTKCVIGGNRNTATFSSLYDVDDYVNGSWVRYTEQGETGSQWKNHFGKTIISVADVEEKIKNTKGLKHKIDIVVPKDSVFIKKLFNIVNTIKKQSNLPKDYKVSWIKDGDVKAKELEEKSKNGDKYINTYVVTMSSKKRIKIANKLCERIENNIDDNFIDGKYCNIGISIQYYQYGNVKGIGCYINQLQLLDANPDFTYEEKLEDIFETFEDEDIINESTNDAEQTTNDADEGTIGEEEVPF